VAAGTQTASVAAQFDDPGRAMYVENVSRTAQPTRGTTLSVAVSPAAVRLLVPLFLVVVTTGLVAGGLAVGPAVRAYRFAYSAIGGVNASIRWVSSARPRTP
jgi:hypothetical protein